MKRLNFDRRQAFSRLVRINDFRGLTRAQVLGSLRALRRMAGENQQAGAFSGYAP
jgi:hypothetical protein